MSWVTLSNRKVKIRKERICQACGIKHSVGTQMHKTAAVDGGDFSSCYWCIPCEEFMKDKWNDWDEGIGEGDVWEYPEYKQYSEQKLKEIEDGNSIQVK